MKTGVAGYSETIETISFVKGFKERKSEMMKMARSKPLAAWTESMWKKRLLLQGGRTGR
jgi:hypothetical protein